MSNNFSNLEKYVITYDSTIYLVRSKTPAIKRNKYFKPLLKLPQFLHKAIFYQEHTWNI